MEVLNTERRTRHRQSKILTGVFVVLFGTLFFLARAGVAIPHWLYSWKMFIIAAGIVTLYKHGFRHFFGYILVALGGIFLINEFRPGTIDAGLIFPAFIILFGVAIILKSTNLFKKKEHRFSSNTTMFDDDVNIDSDDFIDTTTIFGGVTKNVVSKNFKGADLTSVFGGTELNLTKADISAPITINATAAFGGLTLIVPSNWQVKSELLTVFGGVDDKRSLLNDSVQDESKVVTLKGTCIFGGVEIHSYV